MIDLKPCPFCGTKSDIQGGFKHWYVACLNATCFCTFGESYSGMGNAEHIFCTPEKAAEAWNKRPESSPTLQGVLSEYSTDRVTKIEARADELKVDVIRAIQDRHDIAELCSTACKDAAAPFDVQPELFLPDAHADRGVLLSALRVAMKDGSGEEITRLKAVIERDRTFVSDAVIKIRNAIRKREWLRLGRGSFEYNDDRWKDEFGAALDEIYETVNELQRIGRDHSDSPATDAAVQAARDIVVTNKMADMAIDVLHTRGRLNIAGVDPRLYHEDMVVAIQTALRWVGK